MPPAASLCKASALETLWAIVAEYSEDGGHRNLQVTVQDDSHPAANLLP